MMKKSEIKTKLSKLLKGDYSEDEKIKPAVIMGSMIAIGLGIHCCQYIDLVSSGKNVSFLTNLPK